MQVNDGALDQPRNPVLTICTFLIYYKGNQCPDS
jgi:hypothetical protein